MKFDTITSDLQSLADDGIKYAKKMGIDQAEIYVSSTQQINVRNQSGMIDAKAGSNDGVGVRVAKDKKLGFAATSGLTKESIEHAIKEAFSVVKSVKEVNVGFESFAGKIKPGKDGIIDHDIVALSSEDIVKNTNEIFLDAKKFDDRIVGPFAQCQAIYGGHAVANTEGISAASKSTALVLVTSVTAAEGDNRKTSFDFKVARTIPDFDTLGSDAAKKAIDLLDSKPLNHTGVLPTIWNQNVMSNFWGMSLLTSVNGRQVIEKNSYFMDKLGDKVGIDKLNITDDGQLEEGLATTAIDDEGIPRRTTPIIEKGVLRSFLYDDYYGRVGKVESTGNANRGQGYESTPQISPTTIVIKPGTKDFDQMISEIDKGVYVMDNVMGLGHSNLISGDFSIVATSAYYIEKGEIKHPLNSIQIAGNLFKSFKNIIEIGSDTKLLPNVKTPSVVFDGFTVVG
jgi:PmbA protein